MHPQMCYNIEEKEREIQHRGKKEEALPKEREKAGTPRCIVIKRQERKKEGKKKKTMAREKMRALTKGKEREIR